MDPILNKAPFSTHQAPLLMAVFKTDGTIIEMGAGTFSTPLLHVISQVYGRTVKTYESNKSWYRSFGGQFIKGKHSVHLVRDWDKVPVEKASVVFIDHAPASRRVVEIERFLGSTEIFVVHDTDKMNYYGYEPAFNKFKYQYTYPVFTKTTTLLSNQIDVRKFF